jgi:hypothetical protein
MTRPLRRLHLVIWLGLATFLPVLVGAALRGRSTAKPANPSLHWGQYK